MWNNKNEEQNTGRTLGILRRFNLRKQFDVSECNSFVGGI